MFSAHDAREFWESLREQRDQTTQSWRKSTLNIHWKNWCWSWSTNPLATWWEKLTSWTRPWCWKVEGRRRRVWQRMRWLDGITDSRDMTFWANSRRQWRTAKLGLLQFMGSQRVRHDLAPEQQQDFTWNLTWWMSTWPFSGDSPPRKHFPKSITLIGCTWLTLDFRIDGCSEISTLQ